MPMNEETLGREPIELVEIVLPRCINTFGVSPCTATGDNHCFNCRATCQDVANYRDTPDRHLTPDLSLSQDETIASGDLTRTADLFAAFDVRFGSDPDGIIWEQGSSTNGVYLGVESGNLIFECLSSGTGTISVDVNQFVGGNYTLYAEIDFVASGSTEINLWVFDPVELTLTLLGTDTFTAGAAWADTDGGAIGAMGGSTVGGSSRTDVDWNGAIDGAFFYDSTAAPADMSDNFNNSLWLGYGQLGEPTGEKYILPCLTDLSSVGSRINVAAGDDDYEPLGRRASLDFSAKNFNHSGIYVDPYLGERKFNVYDKAPFWSIFLQQQKFGRVGALTRVYDGYAGMRLSDYRRRSYVLDKVTSDEDTVGFRARDILSKTEFDKAKVPAVSTGTLWEDLAAAELSAFRVSGDVREDYPVPGTVRINDEVLQYSATSYVAGLNYTEFTISQRASDGSTAADHDTDDLVQLCRRYTNATIPDVLSDFYYNDSRIPGQFVDQAGLEDEYTTYLDAYTITTLITEPTAVNRLVGEMCESFSMYVWWDERSQKIRHQAIRAVDQTDLAAEWTYEDNIIGGTLRIVEKPKQRLNVVELYYNPIDYTEDLDKPSHFHNGIAVINGTSSLAEQYGDYIQSRTIFSRWLSTEAEANQTSSRLALRFADVVNYVEFMVDAKDRLVWNGDFITLSVPFIVNERTGERAVRRYLVLEAEEVEPGHIAKYLCADITLDGTIYFITPNGVGTYDEQLFLENNYAYITDNFGLNPDGTPGATIS